MYKIGKKMGAQGIQRVEIVTKSTLSLHKLTTKTKQGVKILTEGPSIKQKG